MSTPDISAVMCVRNGEAYIAEALDSIAAQREAGIVEVIVIDDGSTDRSVQIAQAHACSPRIVQQDALGQPFALNRGVAEARGRYLAFIDCDDVWPGQRLAVLRAAAVDAPLSSGAFGCIRNTDAQLGSMGPPIPARMLTSGLIKRDAFADVGPFRTDVRHASNVDWISRAAAAGLTFAAVEAVVLLRRVHGDNMGITDVTKGRSDMLRVIRDHHARTRK